MSEERVGNDRVLSITVTDEEAGTARHHFNVDNIAFVSSVEKSPTAAGWAVAVLLTVVSGWILLQLLDGWLWGAGGILVGVVVVALLSMGRHEIGTVADTYDIDASELRGGADIEAQLLDLAPETIAITDRERHFLYTLEYRHYFLPKNVVSIRETARAPLVAILLLVVVFPLELIYGGLEYGVPILLGARIPGRALPGLEHFLATIGYVVVVIVPTLYVLSRLDEIKQVEINTPAGTDHAFDVTPGDARRVLAGLQSRDEERVTAETRRA